MSLNWIREQAKSRLMPNDIDFTEFNADYDFALRPEIIGFLTGQTTTGQPAGLNNSADYFRLVLDEHELAIS